MSLKDYTEVYKKNLLEDVMPFWENHSPDVKAGGFFTCLDKKGEVYDKDKFIWLQCRQVWTFSVMYNLVERKQKWLNLAIHGAEFLKKYGRDREGNWYFSLTREGQPLVQPYNIFSDCFAAMAFGQLYKATKDEEYKTISLNTFYNILKRKENPKGSYNKGFPETRPLKMLSLPMILSNLVVEIEHILDPVEVQQVIDNCKKEVLEDFYDEKSGLILENVTADGNFSDCFEGRLIMPGHSLESMWFMMDIGEKTADNALIKKAVDISLNILEYGWDKEFGGIFYMMDIKGNPCQQLEWDQKLWWVHLEAIVCMIKGFRHSGDERCYKWFKRLHKYTWDRFPDKENGEWYGYLNRKGEVLLSLKGGKWKGCFHVPRCLYQVWKNLDMITEKNALIKA